MTASRTKPRVRRERRIIERPRLIKLLDESEARIILLLAPAGYGKTTLARQWAKTLSGAIWVTLTPAHRDVARFAESIATGVDLLGGEASGFISEYVRAKGNAQRAARQIALALAHRLTAARVQWVVLDDYHEVNGTPEIAEFLAALEEDASFRLLATARSRPTWATPRRRLYGEIAEIGRNDLAMDDDESRRMLGKRPDLLQLVSRAEGWPAVLGLAASGYASPPPQEVMPKGLYTYLADEIFRSAPEKVRSLLLELALAPELTDENLPAPIVHEMRDLGFLSSDQATELHPLIREFLLQKLAASRTAESSARHAVVACIEKQRWDRAFELVLRFGLHDLTEGLVEAAYAPLTRSGHLGTLLTFAESVRDAHSFPPPAIDLVESEAALQNGAFRLAADLATRAREQLPDGHRLASRANAIAGQIALIEGDLSTSVASYRAAHRVALNDQDEADALYGWALTSVQGEVGDPAWVMERLAKRRHHSPLDLIRHACADLTWKRFTSGFPGEFELEEVLRALPKVVDPRARTSLSYSMTYVLALRGEYRKAHRVAESVSAEVEAYGLDFVRSYTDWNLAWVNLGLRRFGAVERYLQLVEDGIRRRRVGLHVLNARILRMRLALQTGELEHALEFVELPDEELAIPSLHGEYLTTQALCLAVGERYEDALAAARSGEKLTTAVEVRVLAHAVRAVVGAMSGTAGGAIDLFALAGRLGTWDPVVGALRSSPPLRDVASSTPALRGHLELLYSRSNDQSLARRAGFRTRASDAPRQILSPREIEVLELIARGFRNREIAKALVISESTTKVHVRHILEKLGVHTRTEAVARLEMFRRS